jgi:hypothetical protein
MVWALCRKRNLTARLNIRLRPKPLLPNHRLIYQTPLRKNRDQKKKNEEPFPQRLKNGIATSRQTYPFLNVFRFCLLV